MSIGLAPGAARHERSRLQDRLISAFGREIRHERLLPSPVGASLVIIGTGLLVAPMWSLLHNVDAIARAVWQILSA